MNKRKLALLLTAVLIISTCALLVEWCIFSSPIVLVPAGAIVVPDNYPTIQSAIDNATAHSTIFVRRGQYSGIVIDKPLTLIGENPQNTLIQGYSHHYDSKNAVTITANYVSISGFNITGGRNALLIKGNYCEITNNSITNNEVTWSSNGVDLLGNNNILKRNYIVCYYTGIICQGNNCFISENKLENCGCGIYVKGNSSGTVDKNFIHGKGSGIALSSTKIYQVYENIIENLGTGIAYEGVVSDSQVYNNSIAHNLYGVYINPETNGKDNIFFSNNLMDNKQQVLVPYGYPDPPLPKGVIFWDNGFVGNYWSDYRVRYPFVVQNSKPAFTYESAYIIPGNNIDHHPLQQEVIINR